MEKKNQMFIIVALTVFLIISFIFITPVEKKQRSQLHSTQLRKITNTWDNIERTDYVDSSGRITIAADLGYATVTITKFENKQFEQYYDNKGGPISRYNNGYYALLREYDDEGNNTRTTYLNETGSPMILSNGCASEVQEYNDKGQIVYIKYYDLEGNPALTTSYGYGRKNEYNENGQIIKITYIDATGMPMMSGLGYASVTRNYYETDGIENGRIESERYYDDNGNPVSLSLGQYGVHKEYDKNGQVSILTYIDASGNPIRTNIGYTTIARTYYDNKTIATEMYYDLAGNPISLSDGQYGTKNIGDHTVYLNQDGEVTFNIKKLLYNYSCIAILITIVIVFLSSIAGKKWNLFFLVIYIGVICYMTIMNREGNTTKNIQFLWSYRKVFIDDKARADIIKNIWLFIPLGAILFHISQRKSVLIIPILISIIIEGIQLITRAGICEFDDVVSNGLGGIIGFKTAETVSYLILRKKTNYTLCNV